MMVVWTRVVAVEWEKNGQIQDIEVALADYLDFGCVSGRRAGEKSRRSLRLLG